MAYVRYYLCAPEEPQIAKQHGYNSSPKGAHELGDAFAVFFPSTSGGPNAWIVGVRRDSLGAMPAVETISNGCRIGKKNLAKLNAAGLDTSGLSVASQEEEIERRVATWFRGEAKTFADVHPLTDADIVDYP